MVYWIGFSKYIIHYPFYCIKDTITVKEYCMYIFYCVVEINTKAQISFAFLRKQYCQYNFKPTLLLHAISNSTANYIPLNLSFYRCLFYNNNFVSTIHKNIQTSYQMLNKLIS